MKGYVLGVDGGGSKTLAVIADLQGRVVGRGQAGPSNLDDVGQAGVQASLAAAVAQARAEAGLPDAPFSAACLGLAGVVAQADHQVIAAVAHSLGLAEPAQLLIDHDCRVALAGGLSGRPGIALIAGTGSSCYGLNDQGESWRAGGWGALLSDEGSAWWYGREALVATVRAADGRGAATQMSAPLLAQLGITHPDDLLHRLHVTGLSRRELAALAPLVMAAARQQDAVALDCLARGTALLAECVVAVAAALGWRSVPVDTVLVGGLFKAGEVLVAPLRHALSLQLPECRLSWPEASPSMGACLLALRRLGLIETPVTEGLQRIPAPANQNA